MASAATAGEIRLAERALGSAADSGRIEDVSRAVLLAGFVFAAGCQRAGAAPVAAERVPAKAQAGTAGSASSS